MESQPRCVVITGGNSGIGLAVAKELLAKENLQVVIAGRNQQRVQTACDELNSGRKAESSKAVPMQLDLNSMESVRAFVRQWREMNLPLSTLVCNAGLSNSALKWTEDGIEQTFGVNHLGHFLLVLLMLQEGLPAAWQGRILLTSSGTHDPAERSPIPPPTLLKAKELLVYKADAEADPSIVAEFNPRRAYSSSKLCNVLFAYKLSKLLSAQGRSAVTVNAYDPGLVISTDLGRLDGKATNRVLQVVKMLMYPITTYLTPWGSTLKRTGAFYAELAVGERFSCTTGKYFSIDKEKKSSEKSYEEALQDELWEISLEACKLSLDWR